MVKKRQSETLLNQHCSITLTTALVPKSVCNDNNLIMSGLRVEGGTKFPGNFSGNGSTIEKKCGQNCSNKTEKSLSPIGCAMIHNLIIA